MAHLPPRLLLIPLFARVLFYWLAIRLILFLFLGPDSLVHTGRSVLVVLVALLLLRVDLDVLRQALYFENLGHGMSRVLMLAAAPVVLIEATTRWISYAVGV